MQHVRVRHILSSNMGESGHVGIRKIQSSNMGESGILYSTACSTWVLGIYCPATWESQGMWVLGKSSPETWKSQGVCIAACGYQEYPVQQHGRVKEYSSAACESYRKMLSSNMGQLGIVVPQHVRVIGKCCPATWDNQGFQYCSMWVQAYSVQQHGTVRDSSTAACGCQEYALQQHGTVRDSSTAACGTWVLGICSPATWYSQGFQNCSMWVQAYPSSNMGESRNLVLQHASVRLIVSSIM